jgi:hypothetical protein
MRIIWTWATLGTRNDQRISKSMVKRITRRVCMSGATDGSMPVGSGRFRDHAQDFRGVLGMPCSSFKNPLNYFQMLLTFDIHHLIGSAPLNRCCL